MCIIFVAFRTHPDYRLVVAANRDEFRDRPTEAAHRWKDGGGIIGGRDLRSGGTWMGIHTDGRFAALTNFREPAAAPAEDSPSRGDLVVSYLQSGGVPQVWLASLAHRSGQWGGFSLFVSDLGELAHLSNRRNVPDSLGPGIWAVSNGLLGDPWPKVERGKAEFRKVVEQSGADVERLMALLRDDSAADPSDLPDTGVGPERERELSPIFIRGQLYGTRSSTVLRIREDGRGSLIEQQWSGDGKAEGRVELEFDVPVPGLREA
ncbi:MAG: NRDE family protein [Thermoanaerobaculia bacterium]